MPRQRRDYAAYNRARRQVLSHSTICHLCGLPGADTVDHLVPFSRGGSAAVSNLRPAHRECNSRRGDRPLHETNFRPDASGAW